MRLADVTGLNPGRPHWARRRGLSLLVSGSLLFLILWRIQPDRLSRVLSQLQPVPALNAFVCVVLAALLLALRWRWMLQIQGMDDGFLAAWQGVLVGNALSAALLGAVLGDVAKSAWYARRHEHPFPGVLLACGLDRLCGGLGLAAYAFAAIMAAYTSGATIPVQWEVNPKTLGWTACALGLAGVVGLFVFRRRGPIWMDHLRETQSRLREAWQALRLRPGLLTAALGVSFLANLLIGATLGCALAAASPAVLPWMSLLWTFPAISLAASLPFTFAGAGAREGAALAIWSWLGIPAPVAVAASLVTLGATLLGAIPGCILFLRRDPKNTNSY